MHIQPVTFPDDSKKLNKTTKFQLPPRTKNVHHDSDSESTTVVEEEQPDDEEEYSNGSDITLTGTTSERSHHEDDEETNDSHMTAQRNQDEDEDEIMRRYLNPPTLHASSAAMSPRLANLKYRFKQVLRFSPHHRRQPNSLDAPPQHPLLHHPKHSNNPDPATSQIDHPAAALPTLSISAISRRTHDREDRGGAHERRKTRGVGGGITASTSFSSLSEDDKKGMTADVFQREYNDLLAGYSDEQEDFALPPAPSKGILKPPPPPPTPAEEAALAQAILDAPAPEIPTHDATIKKRSWLSRIRHSVQHMAVEALPTPSTSTGSQSSVSSTAQRRVRYGKGVSVHETYTRFEYNRESDPYAACTHLTPEGAHHIKAELNAFKFHEMEVHPESRIYTHFFP